MIISFADDNLRPIKQNEYVISLEELLTYESGDFLIDDYTGHIIGDVLLPDGEFSFLDNKREDDRYAAVYADMEEFGQKQAIFVRFNDDNKPVVFNGHHRIAVMIDLGFEEVICTNDPDMGWDDGEESDWGSEENYRKWPSKVSM